MNIKETIQEELMEITDEQRRGLKFAGIAFVLTISSNYYY